MVVGVAGEVSQELYDVVGHQRGWEILAAGVDEPLLVASRPSPTSRWPWRARASSWPRRRRCRPASGPRCVVTDPHYNTLVSHEIVGHPVELDRALKMETAYAGRSWLLRGLDDHQVGQRIASPLVSAYSDPALPGYGHYAYDHEGTPARRVRAHRPRRASRLHEQPPDGGRLRRRAERPLQGDRRLAGAADPHVEHRVRRRRARRRPTSSREVDRGYYLAGHRIPSIAESRENFRISARKVYEIRARPARPALPRRRHRRRHAATT